MRFNKITRHMGGRSRDIYGAWRWSETQSNLLNSIILPFFIKERVRFSESSPSRAGYSRGFAAQTI